MANRSIPSYKVTSMVSRAVKKGVLLPVATQRCCDCDAWAQQYHHNNGYEPEHWLDVVPLCRRCHVARHVEMHRVSKVPVTPFKRITVLITGALLAQLEQVRDGRSYQAVFERALEAWIAAQRGSSDALPGL